jgi:hypothetical protein
LAHHPAAVVALGHKGLPGGEEQTDDAGEDGDEIHFWLGLAGVYAVASIDLTDEA